MRYFILAARFLVFLVVPLFLPFVFFLNIWGGIEDGVWRPSWWQIALGLLALLVIGIGAYYLMLKLFVARPEKARADARNPATDEEGPIRERTSHASEHKTSSGHHSALTLMTVLLVLGIGGELLYALNGPVPNFVRAINQPYDFKAHNIILPQSAFAHKLAEPVCTQAPQSIAPSGDWSSEIPVPYGCIPYTNPTANSGAVQAECKEKSTSSWGSCAGTYISFRLRSEQSVDVWMERAPG